jgi:hypothetical protein
MGAAVRVPRLVRSAMVVGGGYALVPAGCV